MTGQPKARRSFREALAAPGFDSPSAQTPWGEVFLIDDSADEPIPLQQWTGKDFRLTGTLEYTGEMGLDRKSHRDIDEATKRAARRVSGAELGETDLASVPLFLRWFTGPYGRHTPAALIHDHLIIGGAPNGGTLGNDAASDRYFRFMLKAVGVPPIKRWIMWAATAFRTRWAVGGLRRASVVVWVLLAAMGITAAVAASVALISGGDLPSDADEWAVLGAALLLAVAASALWGEQAGAGLVAAGAALWLLPPTIIAALGYGVYWLFERVLSALDRG